MQLGLSLLEPKPCSTRKAARRSPGLIPGGTLTTPCRRKPADWKLTTSSPMADFPSLFALAAGTLAIWRHDERGRECLPRIPVMGGPCKMHSLLEGRQRWPRSLPELDWLLCPRRA